MVLSDILNTEADLEVVDTAENGEELIQKIRVSQPDLVIADFNLPKNNRMFTFRRIQHDFQIPILMLIGKDAIPDDFIFEALKVGVYDYVRISSRAFYPKFRSVRDEIITKVRAVMEVKKHQVQITEGTFYRKFKDNLRLPLPVKQVIKPTAYIVIGASTGGTRAIESIVRALHQDLKAAILVAIHLPDRFTRTFTLRIKSLTGLKVVEGKPGTKVEVGKIIIAPGDKNLSVYAHMGNKDDLRVRFSEEPTSEFDRPSINVLMKSVAKVVGPQSLGIILTGMGADGTEGAKAILNKGGETIAQDEASSTIFGMPKSAIKKGYITKVSSLVQIPDYINRFAEYHKL